MAGRAGLIPADITSGLAAAVHTAREVDLSDPLDAIRTDLSGGIGAGRELVGDAAETLAEALARSLGRERRRSRRRPAAIVLGIGIIGLLVLAAWWLRRRTMDLAFEDKALDRASLDRAADDGMGTAIGAPAPEPGEPERRAAAMVAAGKDGSGAVSA